ncbi:MAG: rhomboid family intramembrane serine protease [Alphaproteobacteria bacterium]|nr:rhomboid family intramembrane serine protease [Alphaproteobacteria bacterium]
MAPDDGAAPRIAPVVSVLLAATALTGILQVLLPSFNAFCLEYLSLRLQAGGEWRPRGVYGFATYVFVHGGGAHLFLNCLWLLLIGQSVAQWLRTRYFLLVYFGGAFAGGALQMLLSPGAILVGASGGLFALLGAFGYRHIVLSEAARRARRGAIIRFVAIMAVMIFIFAMPGMSFGGGNVSWAGHLGGLLAGIALTPMVMRHSARRAVWRGRSFDV